MMCSKMRSTQNYKVYHIKLQCVLCLTTDELQVILHKIAIVLNYTTVVYVPLF